MRLAVLFLALLVPCSAADATTWLVPSQCPTIQAGIDSAGAGDTVLVACGDYSVCELHMKSGVCLRSETGLPDCVTLEPMPPVGHIMLCSYVDSTASIMGFTVARGYLTGRGAIDGAGLTCWISSPKVSDCVFTENWAPYCGGAVGCSGTSTPSFTRCRFVDNYAIWGGGGLSSRVDAHTEVRDCAFEGNSSQHGGAALCCEYDGSVNLSNCIFSCNSSVEGPGAISLWGGSTSIFANSSFCGNSGPSAGSISCLETEATISNCIIAGNSGAPAVVCADGSCVLSCSDINGNSGGDWVGAIADQYGINGNFSACPLFCDPESRDFHLQVCSPCAPGNHPAGYDCGLIGVFGVSCPCGEPSAVEATTWSSLKALYR